MIRIASVSNKNKPILVNVADNHRIKLRLDPYENGQGYHVLIERNYELYFREIISPEYRAAKLAMSARFSDIFGADA